MLGRGFAIAIAAVAALLMMGSAARAADPSLMGQWHP
jgi:hypothetical protein